MGGSRARRRLVSKLVEKHDWVCLQEVREGPADVVLWEVDMKDYITYSSDMSSGNAGGVMRVPT